MNCPVCKKNVIPLRIGATIGATQLRACPECGVVFIGTQNEIAEVKRFTMEREGAEDA